MSATKLPTIISDDIREFDTSLEEELLMTVRKELDYAADEFLAKNLADIYAATKPASENQPRDKVVVKRGRYRLARDRDGAGDAGFSLVSLDPITGERVGEHGELHLGARIQCGSHYARSYTYQDWWMTTAITEFLEVSEDNSYVKFKTGNSVYELWSN